MEQSVVSPKYIHHSSVDHISKLFTCRLFRGSANSRDCEIFPRERENAADLGNFEESTTNDDRLRVASSTRIRAENFSNRFPQKGGKKEKRFRERKNTKRDRELERSWYVEAFTHEVANNTNRDTSENLLIAPPNSPLYCLAADPVAIVRYLNYVRWVICGNPRWCIKGDLCSCR